MTSRQVLGELPMRPLQVFGVGLCIALNAMDGFDVLAISFAAPGIVSEWGISATELGIVLTMELVGMSIGSILLGSFADGLGRRPIILVCLLSMTFGMYFTSTVDSIAALLVGRFVTGLGIGGMLATINAMVAEYSSDRRRNFNIALMVAGYPVGIIIGGSVASILLAHYDWRSVFTFGALMTGALIPLVWFFMPESIAFLVQRNRPDALEKINLILSRMGHRHLLALPTVEAESIRKSSWRDLFSGDLVKTTIILMIAYLAHIMTFYYILKWIPKIVVDMQYAASSAGEVLVWANVGGALGAVVLGSLTNRFNVRFLVIAAMLGSVIMINVFGMGHTNLESLAIVSGIAGFFTNSAVVGMYALLAQSFPTHLRAGGTGFVIGMGRGGAVMGPIIAGLLFDSGFELSDVSFVMALGSLVALAMLLLLRR